MRIAVYPGSFDPVTNGHLDIIERASELFDQVVVAVVTNPSKNPLFDMEERVQMLSEAVKGISNVKIDKFDGLLVDFVQKYQAVAIIRGLRAVSDYEAELQMALINKQLNPRIETVFLMAKADFSFLSSSVIKEVASFGRDVQAFVPPIVDEKLRKKYQIPGRPQ